MKMLLFTPKASTPPIKRCFHVFGCFVPNLVKEVIDVRQEKVLCVSLGGRPRVRRERKHTFYSHHLLRDPSKNGILLSSVPN